MKFQIYLSAAFSSAHPTTSTSRSSPTSSGRQNRKEQRRDDKVRAGIRKRMTMDAYINPLLVKGEEMMEEENDANGSRKMLLPFPSEMKVLWK